MKKWNDKQLKNLASHSCPPKMVAQEWIELRDAAADHIREMQEAVEKLRVELFFQGKREPQEALAMFFWPVLIDREDPGDNWPGHKL